jgi:hypothetical protein
MDPPKTVLQMEDPSKNRRTLLQEAVRASSPNVFFQSMESARMAALDWIVEHILLQANSKGRNARPHFSFFIAFVQFLFFNDANLGFFFPEKYLHLTIV